MELEAIRFFEHTLIEKGNRLAETVGFDFWAADPLKPKTKVIPVPVAMPRDLRQGMRVDDRLTTAQRGFDLPGPLTFDTPVSQDRPEAIALEDTVPAAYRLAAQINWPGGVKDEGQGVLLR